MLSSKPPDSDSEEGQLEFSAKCRTFSTECYTNNTSFFPHSMFLLRKPTTIKRQGTSAEKLH